MVDNKYIKAETFEQFCKNQDALIDVLNHRMTGMEKSIIAIRNDASWMKKLMWAILGVLLTSFIMVLINSLERI